MESEPRSSGNMAMVVIVALLVIALVAFGAFALLGNQAGDGGDDEGGIDITIPAPTIEGSSLQWDLIEAGAFI